MKYPMLLAALFAGCIDPPALEGTWHLEEDCYGLESQIFGEANCGIKVYNDSDKPTSFQILDIVQPSDCSDGPFSLRADKIRIQAWGWERVRVDFHPTVMPDDERCRASVSIVREEGGTVDEQAIELMGIVEDIDLDLDGVGLGQGDCDDRADKPWRDWVEGRGPRPEPSGPGEIPAPHEIHPYAIETCNGVDDDCDGLIDDADDERLEPPSRWPSDEVGDRVDPITVLDGAHVARALYCYGDRDFDDWPSRQPAMRSCVDPGNDVDCYSTPWEVHSPQPLLDCNDDNELIHPGAVEDPEQPQDRDCDGLVTCFADQDGDGFGGYWALPDGTLEPSGVVHVSADLFAPCQTGTDVVSGVHAAVDLADCDDRMASVNPVAPEYCNAIDDDCDRGVDDDDRDGPPFGALPWYLDSDHDGWGVVGGDPLFSCREPSRVGDYVLDSTDCGDDLASIHPGGVNGRGEQVPAGVEVCNTRNDDCDDQTDEIDDEAAMRADAAAHDRLAEFLWYADLDHDGFGDGNAEKFACIRPELHVAIAEDCDDESFQIGPTQLEGIADGVDQDCDGHEFCFLDVDRDGFGAGLALPVPMGAGDPCSTAGWSSRDNDCDDDSAAVAPGAEETCNGIDDDCDDAVDAADSWVAGLRSFYRDGDGDGFFSPVEKLEACSGAIPVGWEELPATIDVNDPNDYRLWRDCDDFDDRVKPGATELPADGIDQDCDGEELCYLDADGDGFGLGAPEEPHPLTDAFSITSRVLDCDHQHGFASILGDCDDDDAHNQPAARERCDGVDNDCDGDADDADLDEEPLGARTWFEDRDADGFGDPFLPYARCGAAPGFIDNARDCDDSSADISPTAPEVCDARDNDCDDLVDDEDRPELPGGLATDLPGHPPVPTWWRDLDHDGFGTDISRRACFLPSADWAEATGDCVDTDPLIHPGAVEEVADGVDNDCDEFHDCYADDDGDGVGSNELLAVRAHPLVATVCDIRGASSRGDDCDDSDGLRSPMWLERCDGANLDEDCDGSSDDNDLGGATDKTRLFSDADGDGHATPVGSILACDAPVDGLGRPTWLPTADDCDDTRATVHPGADETCSGLDDDCDGLIDDDDVVIDATLWYADRDGDGQTAGETLTSCAAPVSFVPAPSVWEDCDDRNPNAFHGQREVVNNGVDEDCNGTESCFCDKDGDGLGVGGTPVESPSLSCDAPPHAVDGTIRTCGVDAWYSSNTDDCNDLDGDQLTAETLWYHDRDGDGFSDLNFGALFCEPPDLPAPERWVTEARKDCDDDASGVFPGAPEVCNGLDDDCDRGVDEGVLASWWTDRDRDGFGDPTSVVTACLGADPVGVVAPGVVDCDDRDPGVSQHTWWWDGDGDDHGAEQAQDLAAQGVDPVLWRINGCERPVGYAEVADDCADQDRGRSPSELDYCDGSGVDEDCDHSSDDADGVVPDGWLVDRDRDGYGAVQATVCTDKLVPPAKGGDCDDTAEGVHPNAREEVDGMDEDCDGIPDVGGSWGTYEPVYSETERSVYVWISFDDVGWANQACPENYHGAVVDWAGELAFLTSMVVTDTTLRNARFLTDLSWVECGNTTKSWYHMPECVPASAYEERELGSPGVGEIYGVITNGGLDSIASTAANRGYFCEFEVP